MSVRIGTAGWAIPRTAAPAFPSEGSGLERYAAVFNAAEINSTFYRPHKRATFERWSSTTPPGFRFSVKAPKAVTHERHLVDADDLMAAFLDDISALGSKLGPVLVQLPPSLVFNPATAEAFFEALRHRYSGPLVVEPRHASWFEPDAEHLLQGASAARAAADPARVPAAAEPGGFALPEYWRWHGSPHMYRSGYDTAELAALAARLALAPEDSWVIFDNTTLGRAAADALALKGLIGG